MTPFQNLSQSEQAAINMARAERNLAPLGNVLQVSASIPSFLQSVTAQSPAVPTPGSEAAVFNAGVASERQRSLFADRVRLAIARRLANTAQGSRDVIAVALLSSQPSEIKVESVLPPPPKELTQEQRDFADRLIGKIAQVRGYAVCN
jgi:hypothetical protein